VVTNSFSTTAGNVNGTAASAANASFFFPVFSNQATWYIGRAFQKNNSNGGVVSSSVALAGMYDLNTLQCYICVNGSNNITLVKGDNSTILGTGVTTLLSGIWYYIEVMFTINSTSGACTVMINGATDFSVTNVATAYSGNNYANTPYISTNNQWTEYIDDIYVCDSTGSANNTFLGVNHIDAVIPSGAGSTTNFTPLSGSNWQEVSELNPDGDTSDNYAATAGSIDLFTHNNLSAVQSSIRGVSISCYARKNNAGTKAISPLVSSNSVQSSTTSIPVVDSYTYATQLLAQDPHTSAAWTGSAVNACQFGYKIIT